MGGREVTLEQLKTLAASLAEARKQCEFAYQFHPSTYTTYARCATRDAHNAVMVAIAKLEKEAEAAA
jgi:hypothetical protein